jgi:hypothetical protein
LLHAQNYKLQASNNMASNRSTRQAPNQHQNIQTSQRQPPIVVDSVVNEVNAERRQKKVTKQKQLSPVAPVREIKFEKRSTQSVSGSTTKAKATRVNVTSNSTKPLNATSTKKKKTTPIGSSSNLQAATTKKEESLPIKRQDIVWRGFKSKVNRMDDSSVAGSLQGSWASAKVSQSSERSGTSSAVAAKSSASCHVRPDERIESKRRHSTSALSSLVRGGIRLSPFVKDTLRSKHSRSLQLAHDSDLQRCPEKKCDGKKVRFVVTSEGKIKPDIASPPSRLKLTPETIKVLWWTGEERQAMKRRAQRIGLRFLSITAKYHLAVEQMLSKCRSEVGEGRSQFFAEKDAIRILIDHDARGLELAMISALNLDSCRHYHRCVKQSVICVLNAQSMWKCSNLKSDDEQWQMIATVLQQYSVVATRFARILAEGDARFVRGHYISDADVESSSLIPGLSEESSMSTSSSSEDYDYLDGSFTI